MPLKSRMKALFLLVAGVALASALVIVGSKRVSVSDKENGQTSVQGRSPLSLVVPELPPSSRLGIGEPTAPNRTGIEPPVVLLSKANTFVDAIREAAAAYGPANYQTRRTLMLAKSLCRHPDPTGSLALPVPDPTRDWALESIADLCVGLDDLDIDETASMQGEPSSLLLVHRSQGLEAALEAAEGQLMRESDPILLQEAALFAWENGRGPPLASMGLSQETVSPSDQMAAIAEAVQWQGCAEMGGCGPRSWQTLALCARVGCPPNSSFEQGLRASLNQQRTQLVLGYVRWLGNLRKG